MRHVFERYTPGVVFHAAAYKHVPLMEANPLESVRNNTLATRVIAEVAVEFGVERFVLVSTDKAVNPKTVMGQSKALCEWIVEAYGARQDIATRFVAVRFGNVLGSSGQRDPDLPPPDRARRAGHRHAPGDDALLHDDPGGGLADRPGRRRSAAAARCSCSTWASRSRSSISRRNMIRLSGKEPERDVAIEFIGVRPGEKLHEELWGEGETVGDTPHPKILAVTRPSIDAGWLDDELAELERLVADGRDARARRRSSAR